MARPDGFDEFCAEQGWRDHIALEARKIATARLMRGFPPLTEKEWLKWGELQTKKEKWR